MPAKGWKKNAEGKSVSPSDPTHPDMGGGVALETPEMPGQVVPEEPRSKPRSLTPDEAAVLTDRSLMSEKDNKLPDWDRTVKDGGVEALAYWVGCLPGCPVQNAIVGGISFPRKTQRVGEAGFGTLTARSDQKGAVAYLTAAQVKKVMHGARALVVRKKGGGAKARRILLNADPAHFVSDKMNPGQKVREYVRQRGDIPIGCYIYMVPYDDALGPNYQDGWPAPLVPLPEDG